MRRVAPGWSQTAGPLQPNRKSVIDVIEQQPAQQQQEEARPMDAMQELVEHLSKLDAAATAAQEHKEQQQRDGGDLGPS